MSRLRILLVIVAGALTLSGCSVSRDQSNAWRKDAEAFCLAKDGFRKSAFAQRIDRIKGNGSCGIWYPIRVTAAHNGYVGYSQPETLNCPATMAIERWFSDVVQPAAMGLFGSPVVRARTMGSYNCRTRNHKRGAKMSEHSYGNAIDYGGFMLANGREISVLKGWRGAMDEAIFLREIHKGACRFFTTVIGPDGDRHHQDHFHFDLARHNKNNSYRYCR